MMNPIQPTLNGPSNLFVAEMNPAGSALLYSTYLGGSGGEGGSNGLTSLKPIALDAMGNAYIVGATRSTDFPVTPKAFQTIYGGGSSDALVAKISPADAPGISLIPLTLNFGNQ